MVTSNPVPQKPPMTPPDRSLVERTIETRFPSGLTLRGMIPLAGDASNRRYYRVDLDGGLPRSVILMQLAEPEGFKQSEEAVSGAAHHIDELPFLNIRTHLAKADVSVPALHYYDQVSGLLYLEDFGDVTLAEAVSKADAAVVVSRYQQAIDMLVRIQVEATSPADSTCLAFHRGFDAPLLMWEFDHFVEYGLVARLDRPVREGDVTVIRREFARIADMLAGEPRVFVHRD